jgi:hypothetical protein
MDVGMALLILPESCMIIGMPLLYTLCMLYGFFPPIPFRPFLQLILEILTKN